MSLASLVELYRVCGRPSLRGPNFACVTDYLPIQALLRRIRDERSARFDEIIVDGIDMLDDPLPEHGEKISFRLRLSTGSSTTFHKNLECLLDIDPSISRGKLPPDYYLVEEDYYSGDLSRPKHVEALDRVRRLILGLSGLAHYHDEKPSNGYLRLVFIQPTNGPGVKPMELETRVTMPIVQAATDLEPRLVEELSESSAANDPHHSAKVGVFGTSLAAFVGSRPGGDAFEYLVTHWRRFVIEYQRDLSTYLSGFAFHKAKTEVAEAELKITGEFSKVLSDITGKLLGIPISVASIIAIYKADSLIERLLLVLGIVVASLVISRTVDNQERQLDRIKSAKELVLGAIEGKKESYPKDLAEAVEKMGHNLQNDEDGLRNSLRFFRVLSWLPIAIAIGVLGYIYWDELSIFLHFVFCTSRKPT